MIVLRMVLCGFCNSARPVETTGADGLPPGEYAAKLEILKTGICIPCGTRFSDGISRKGNVSQDGTAKRQHTGESS